MSEKLRSIGHRIVRLEKVESTNTLMLETPDYMEHHGLVLLAGHQSEGRGRMGRAWASLPGQQLQFTVALHPTLPPAELPILSLVAAVAVAQAVETQLGVRPGLKWPNDVLMDGRKVCGILLEARPGPEGALRLVMGIGINCLGTSADFPEALQPLLTTLAHATGKPVSMEPLLQEILANLEFWYAAVHSGEKQALVLAWMERGLLKGRRVRVDTEEGMRECTPLGLTAEGYLLVEAENGERFVQISGDLEWILTE